MPGVVSYGAPYACRFTRIRSRSEQYWNKTSSYILACPNHCFIEEVLQRLQPPQAITGHSNPSRGSPSETSDPASVLERNHITSLSISLACHGPDLSHHILSFVERVEVHRSFTSERQSSTTLLPSATDHQLHDPSQVRDLAHSVSFQDTTRFSDRTCREPTGVRSDWHWLSIGLALTSSPPDR